MKRRKKKTAPVYFTGVYMPREQDVLLKMYAVSKLMTASEAMRRILSSFFESEGITQDTCTAQIISNVCKEWQAYNIKFEQFPDKEITFDAFLHQRLKKLPTAIINEIIIKAKNEKD